MVFLSLSLLVFPLALLLFCFNWLAVSTSGDLSDLKTSRLTDCALLRLR